MKGSLSLIAAFFIFTSHFLAQSTAQWLSIDESLLPREGRAIFPEEYEIFAPTDDFIQSLQDLPIEEEVRLQIPLPKLGLQEFIVRQAPIMHERLADRLPQIKTFVAINPDNPSESGRLDITHKGFHGMLFTDRGTVYIDPYHFNNPSNNYLVYYKRDFRTDKKFSCGVTGHGHHSHGISGLRNTTGEIMSFRLAVSATGEYTSFHGGTKEDAMDGIVTTMNRVTGIYERELAITFELVANNMDVVYTNSTTDPFTNGNPGTMLNENQSTLNSIIGGGNYDIGHVFGTDSGGLAFLGAVCSFFNKARGVTGSSAPIGDPFDVDYVSHEMGHQFGAEHTFNNCSPFSQDGNGVEPGSGSTIMAYAGLCGANNVQFQSDDYFHNNPGNPSIRKRFRELRD